MGLVIVTVTPNPAYDVTYEVASLSPGEVHRVSTVRRRPGGKGVNVAAVLASLGTPVIATGLATTGFDQDVERIGVRAAFVAALPRVRSTLAISHGPTTSLWEPGVAPRDPVAAAAALEAEVARLLVDAHCLVVSGSLPPGVDPALPVALARLAREHGLPCVLDVAGEALGLAADCPGVVLMPNAEELAELCGPSRSLVEVADASRRLLERGPSMVFATRGAEGLVLTTSEGSWHVPAVPGVTGNATGAGDAATAAVARGLAAGHSPVAVAEEAVALAATAVAAPVAGVVDVPLYLRLRTGVAAQPLTTEGTR